MPQLPSYIPQVYRSNSNLAEMIMRRGEQQANAQRDLYGGIGQTIAGLGAEAGNLIGQRQEQKKVEAHQAEMSKRDAAWVSYVESGEWTKDPAEAYKITTRIWGAGKEAEEHFKGLQGASQLMQPKRDPAADTKALGYIIAAMKKTPEAGRQRLFPQAAALAKSAFPEIKVGDQYDPQTWPEIEALGDQINGVKPVEPAKPLSLDAQLAATAPGTPEYAAILQKKRDEAAATRAPREAKEVERFWVIRNNEPVRITEGEYRPGDKPVSTKEQGRPVTSGDAGTFTDLNTALDDVVAVRASLAGNKATGTMAAAGAALPNAVTEFTGWGADAKAKQATIDRVKQVIGKALEEGVLRKEDELKYTKILPTISDPPELVTAKLDGLEKAIKKKLERHAESLSKAGYDTSRFAGPSAGNADDPLGFF